MSFQQIDVERSSYQNGAYRKNSVGPISAINGRYQNPNGFYPTPPNSNEDKYRHQRGGAVGSRASSPAVPPTPVVEPGAAGTGKDPLIGAISDGLLQYQQNISILQKIVQAIGTQQDSEELHQQYCSQLDAVNELCNRIEQRLKTLASNLEHLSRQEAARRRAAHVKLSKDFGRLHTLQESLESEAKRRQDRMAEERKKFVMAHPFEGGSVTDSISKREKNLMLQAQLQEQRVNQAIIEETEREMMEINKKLHQVNEIYKDLAELVVTQSEQVNHIEATTEAAHARAKAGLEQVKKAHDAQPVCAIS